MKSADIARLGLSYGMSLIAYHTGRAPRPFSAAFAVTNRCNLRCAYCNTPFMDPTHLPLDRVAFLFDRLRELGVSRLGLVGGEPLVRKDIDEIVALARERNFYITFNSNLVLYHRRPEVFDEVDLVFTSLDGDEETHCATRGTGSYDGVLDAIQSLVERGKPVVAIQVVQRPDLGQAEGLLKLADQIGFQIHFQPQCVDTTIVRGSVPESVTSEALREHWAGLLAFKRAGRPVASSTLYLEEQAQWSDFRISAKDEPDQRCAAGRGFLYIDPLGDAYPCAFTNGMTEPINLLEENWRRAFPGKTPCTVCNVGPMLEFNLLFQNPMATSLDALHRIS
jgi:MoaA/NifB/PqqE/SkfB family radical SAM enzyme